RADQLVLRRHRADDDVSAIGANALKIGNAGEVDQMRRSCEAELHHGDEAVPAGEGARVLAKLIEQPDGFSDRCRTMVGERSGYHWRSSRRPIQSGCGQSRGRCWRALSAI